MFKNSMRQLFRTKLQTILFFSLIALCAMLICLGMNLVKQCQDNMEKFKEAFMTIGTVEQKPITYVRVSQYSADTQNYAYYNAKEYGPMFSLSELDMEGVTYISGPERRAFYSVYLPQYKIYDDKEGRSNCIVVEASPVEDCVPSGPVRMQIKNVYYSIYEVNFEYFYYCDHNNDAPPQMYADQSYMMCISEAAPHGFQMGNPDNNPYEYRPFGAPYSTQATADGTLIPNDLPGMAVEEMNDDFYTKGHDRYWNAYAKEMDCMLHNIPVTATDDLNLMMPFYRQEVNVTAGEILSEEDFSSGNAVCLIEAGFARRNGIEVGDAISLPLRTANYAFPPSISWGDSSLTATGENFEAFYTGDYTVKGIYRESPGGGTDLGYTLQRNEIIIPKKSVKADDSENIASYGRYVSPYNTSFCIPNGTIDEFMEEWEKKGIDDVTIHFFDRGYSKLEDGILQMEKMATYLLIAGVVMTILVLVFFCSMMIGGQKKRTAIERSLGSSKRKCAYSLLSGILVVATVGCLIGCLVGAIMTKSVATVMTEKQIFDRDYSAGVVYSEVEEEQTSGADWVITLATFVGVMGFTALVSAGFTCRNLKEEPLVLLSGE